LGETHANERMEELMNDMDRCGWGVKLVCLDEADSMRLRQECQDGCDDGAFREAGVGLGLDRVVRPEIRSDQILWLEPGGASVEQGLYLGRLEVLRLALNQRFFLGLFDFEGHFAIYPEGAFYKPHLDRHAGTSERMVTAILYLNPNWQPGDGGELKLWTTSGDREGAFVLIEPRLGTLVCFLAGEFWHEVLPAVKSRMSITGWFRRR
jgi:SM-20-related protein